MAKTTTPLATEHLDRETVEVGLTAGDDGPADRGRVEMIVARPREDERVVLDRGVFSIDGGLEGDNWRTRGSANPLAQVTAINRRLLDLVAGGRERWQLAGDQLVVDLDLSEDNLPVGQRLRVGRAIFEVSSKPHTGCKKFAARYGVEVLAAVSTRDGRRRRLRGIYLCVVEPGAIAVGDTITKLAPAGGT